jgi:hypothetical protein
MKPTVLNRREALTCSAAPLRRAAIGAGATFTGHPDRAAPVSRDGVQTAGQSTQQ